MVAWELYYIIEALRSTTLRLKYGINDGGPYPQNRQNAGQQYDAIHGCFLR